MNDNFAEQLAKLPDFLAGHLLLSVTALLVGTAISLPLGVVAARHRGASRFILTAAGIVQTVPGLALLALMVPLLGGTIGFLPAFLALALYSLLPTLRNTVAGLSGVDPTYVEAARGVGMTEAQQLWRVELPLALPVIIAGIRTATVWVVGTATLSTPVGATSLGNYIFFGLQTRNWLAVLFGCFFAALLAIVLDRLLSLLESGLERGSRRRVVGAAASLAVIVFAGLVPLAVGERPSGEPSSVVEVAGRPDAAGKDRPLEGQTYRIGSKPFTEQYILASLIEDHLEARGARAEALESLGSTILFDALAAGQVDVYVDYSGTIWSTVMKRDAPVERTAMFIEVAKFLHDEYDILVLGRLGFENAYGFAMRRDVALEKGIRTIADLAGADGRLSIGGDPEFFGRPDWFRVRDAYGLQGLATRSMDSTFMYGAARDRKVDVIGAYTTDGRIAAFDLVVLDDPSQAFPPYDAILMISPDAQKKPGAVRELTRLVNRIDGDTMREANRQVDLDGVSPALAAEHLQEQVLPN